MYPNETTHQPMDRCLVSQQEFVSIFIFYRSPPRRNILNTEWRSSYRQDINCFTIINQEMYHHSRKEYLDTSIFSNKGDVWRNTENPLSSVVLPQTMENQVPHAQMISCRKYKYNTGTVGMCYTCLLSYIAFCIVFPVLFPVSYILSAKAFCVNFFIISSPFP